MFCKLSRCIKSCFDESKSYGVTSVAGRRPSVEGAPSENNEIQESVLTMFRARHPNVDLPCNSDITNNVPNRVDYQQVESSHQDSQVTSMTAEIPDDVLRMSWAHHRYLDIPRRSSRVHFSEDISKPEEYQLNESHRTSGASTASSKPTSSATGKGSNDPAHISESELTDRRIAEHDTGSALEVQKKTEEIMQFEGMADIYNEETIGSKFEAVHMGKSVLKIGARKRDAQAEDREVRNTTNNIVRL